MYKNKTIIIILLLAILFMIPIEVGAESNYKGDLWNLLNYLKIKKAVIKYKKIEGQGGWPTLPYNIVLRKGDSAEEILILKKRLYKTRDLSFYNNDKLFDESLENALRIFQHRHGIVEDGVLGPETIIELNIPVSKRIKQLQVNKEKIYSLFDDYVNRYILVNVPDYKLHVIEDGEDILSMKAIVGKENSRTPIFADQLEYLVLNPTWRIPIQKVVKDVIPLIQKNDYYLKNKNIKVFSSWEEDAQELVPETIDWSKYNINNFDLMLEQEPGPDNELGQVKFMFPNDYLVYIHDTPDKELFNYKNRLFSSGCIRVEKPFELAHYFLKDLPGWNWEKIMQVIDNGEQTHVDLAEPVPVLIVYWTAWVDEHNKVHFRKDIYNHYNN